MSNLKEKSLKIKAVLVLIMFIIVGISLLPYKTVEVVKDVDTKTEVGVYVKSLNSIDREVYLPEDKNLKNFDFSKLVAQKSAWDFYQKVEFLEVTEDKVTSSKVSSMDSSLFLNSYNRVLFVYSKPNEKVTTYSIYDEVFTKDNFKEIESYYQENYGKYRISTKPEYKVSYSFKVVKKRQVLTGMEKDFLEYGIKYSLHNEPELRKELEAFKK